MLHLLLGLLLRLPRLLKQGDAHRKLWIIVLQLPSRHIVVVEPSTVTWTITDLCDTITLSAQFIVTPAPAVTYNQPSDLTTAACSYTAQAGIDAAFATWVATQTAAIAQGRWL
jgi:hypothetical protein